MYAMSGDSANQAGGDFENIPDTPEQADDPFRQNDPWHRGDASSSGGAAPRSWVGGRRRGERSSGTESSPGRPPSSADEDSRPRTRVYTTT